LLRRVDLSAVLRELSVGALFLVLSAAMSWPLALGMGTYVSDPGDPWLNAWILDWGQRGTFLQPLSLFQAPIFHPSLYALAFSEHIYGIALLTLPFRLLGAGPVMVHNIALLLGFAGSGYGAYVLARVATGSTPAALVGGVFFAFVPYRFDQLPHVQHIWSIWLPLLAASLIHYARRPGPGRAALFGAVFLMNGLTNIHWFLFGSFAIVLTAIFIAAVQRRMTSKDYWLPLGLAALLASLLLLPFFLPYHAASNLYQMKRGRSESEAYSATFSDWLRATPRNRVYGSLGNAMDAPAERKLFPGLLAILLAATAIARARRDDFEVHHAGGEDHLGPPRRTLVRALDVLIVMSAGFTYWAMAADRIVWRVGEVDLMRAAGASVPAMILTAALLVRLWIRYPDSWGSSLAATIRASRFPLWMWIALLWVAIGVLGSLGMNAFFHTFLFQKIEIFRSVRVPARWAMIAYTGLALLAAAGVATLFRERSARGRFAIAASLSALLLIELRAAPILWYSSPEHPAAVYEWLARQPLRGAVVELPIGSDVWVEGPYLIGQTAHRKRLVNGFSGFEPPQHAKLVGMFTAAPIDPSFAHELESIGCSLLIVHADRLGGQREQTLSWLREGLRKGRLAFIGRFEHHVRGDWVFALPRVEPATLALPLPGIPDHAGRLPLENLELLLSSDDPLYNASTFGRVDTVRDGQQIDGPLEIAGWALSPHGVAAVNVLLEGGRVSIPATLVPRGDVTAAYPWYPQSPTPGFQLAIPERPKGVSSETYLQVEIVDGRGIRTRLDPLFVLWK
jgi:hypothetical protein